MKTKPKLNLNSHFVFSLLFIQYNIFFPLNQTPRFAIHGKIMYDTIEIIHALRRIHKFPADIHSSVSIRSFKQLQHHGNVFFRCKQNKT